MPETKVDTSKCSTCKLYGEVGGGDIVPYGSTTARLPTEYGCVEEHDGDPETGELIDTSNCSYYQELDRCPKHPDQYIHPHEGCAQCEAEAWEELDRALQENPPPEPKVTVLCPKCGTRYPEDEVEFLGIEEDPQGRDLETFKCPLCQKSVQSLRYG